MAWTTVKTWVVSEPMTAGDLNTYVRDNLAFLYGDSAWTSVGSFNNSWVNYGGALPAAAYLKVGRVVFLRGHIKTGTLNLSAFTLPAGYRPAASAAFAVTSNNLFGSLIINTDGTVVPSVGSNTEFGLSCSWVVA
jgi:hypothetical protein